MRDVDGLRNHVMGEKHVRKALDYKCQVMGIDKQVIHWKNLVFYLKTYLPACSSL